MSGPHASTGRRPRYTAGCCIGALKWRRERCLIVNADDFGRSPGINRGVIQGHVDGVVTSTSLMVRWPAARDAVARARAHPRLSLGLHFDAGEWACRRSEWQPLYQVVNDEDVEAVSAELERQLDGFRALVGRDPTHLDSHQHVHRLPRLRSIFLKAAARLGVPVRGLDRRVRYCGSFYGQTHDGRPLRRLISTRALIAVLEALPPGYTELGCHPGAAVDLESMYLRERLAEVRSLCSGRVRVAIERLGIRLCSFAEVATSP